MAFVHGKSAVFKFDNSAATLVDLSSYCEDVSLPRNIETAETTTFGAAGGSKTYIVGLNDATISVSGKWDATLDAHMAGVATGAQASYTFEVGPEGSATGKIKYTGEALLTSYEVGATVGDAVTWSAQLQVTGAVSRTTF